MTWYLLFPRGCLEATNPLKQRQWIMEFVEVCSQSCPTTVVDRVCALNLQLCDLLVGPTSAFSCTARSIHSLLVSPPGSTCILTGSGVPSPSLLSHVFRLSCVSVGSTGQHSSSLSLPGPPWVHNTGIGMSSSNDRRTLYTYLVLFCRGVSSTGRWHPDITCFRSGSCSLRRLCIQGCILGYVLTRLFLGHVGEACGQELTEVHGALGPLLIVKALA